jgi:hypothetical protein
MACSQNFLRSLGPLTLANGSQLDEDRRVDVFALALQLRAELSELKRDWGCAKSDDNHLHLRELIWFHTEPLIGHAAKLVALYCAG